MISEKPPGHSIAETDIKAAKDVLSCFLKAVKNCSLYPPDHTITKQSVARAKTILDAFLEENGELRFIVKPDSFIFQGTVAHTGPQGNDNPAFLFFSDGIQWIEFQKGISLEELVELFDIINSHSGEQNTAEGDIVTALWEKKFPNFQYKAEDVLWEAAPIIDFSQSPAEKENTFEPEPDGEPENQKAPLNRVNNDMSCPLTALTPEEKKALRMMVVEHEMSEKDDDVLDVLLIILAKQSNAEDFSSILDFQKELLKNTIAEGKFNHAAKFLKDLYDIQSSFRRKNPWAADLIDHFRSEISRPGFLDVLHPHWKLLDSANPVQKDMFVQFLRLLPSESILALMLMLNKIKSPRIQHHLMGIIRAIAVRDIHPLEQLLGHPDTALVQRAVHIMGYLKDEKSAGILRKLISHSSQPIRKEALKSLISRNSNELKKMASLIEDESLPVRQLMFNYLGKRRSATAETFLLDYLKNEKYKINTRRHILACYQLLGKCGSKRSIPFLRHTLLEQPFRFGRSLYRQGAAVALRELGIENASTVLDKASRSLIPGIRKAYQKAFEGKK